MYDSQNETEEIGPFLHRVFHLKNYFLSSDENFSVTEWSTKPKKKSLKPDCDLLVKEREVTRLRLLWLLFLRFHWLCLV